MGRSRMLALKRLDGVLGVWERDSPAVMIDDTNNWPLGLAQLPVGSAADIVNWGFGLRHSVVKPGTSNVQLFGCSPAGILAHPIRSHPFERVAVSDVHLDSRFLPNRRLPTAIPLSQKKPAP